jgi:lipopolysaccharide export system protein LptA
MKRVVVLLLGLSLSSVALAASPQKQSEAKPAEKSQRDEPIYIESDSLSIDDAKGISTYQGNVLFRQGLATLRADTLVIHSRDRQEVEKIVASGAPAHFEQRSEAPNEDALGEAQRIEYIANKALVILDGQARFRQGDNQFAGNRIEYDSDKKVVRAGKSVAPEGGRVRIVIQPRGTSGDTNRAPNPSSSGEQGGQP